MSDSSRNPPDRVIQIIAWFRNHKFFAPLIVLFMALAVVAGLWKPLFGESIRETVNRFFGNSGPAYSTQQECLTDTNANMRKVSKCYRDFPSP